MIYAGIDAGSRAIKVVLVDGQGRIIGRGLSDQGVHQRDLAWQLYRDTLERAGSAPDEIASIVATGYGRDALEFAGTTITEISCHARGAIHAIPAARTIIDIGGQDSKLIRLDGRGRVADFVMNDRCAAGTGRFLEVAVRMLETDLQTLGTLAQAAENPALISNMCAVFAETEIIGLLASGIRPEDIVAGVIDALLSRTGAMAGSRLVEPVLFTGGVALIRGIAERLGSILGCTVRIPEYPQMTGALGAALLALDSVKPD